MNKLKYILLIIFTTSFTSIKAQFDSSLSNFSDLSYLFNPATTGINDNLLINIYNRQQWTNAKNYPNTMIIHVSYPWKTSNRIHGLGLTISKESIGLFSNQTLVGQYSYTIKLSDAILKLGFQAGIIQQSFDASSIYIPQNDNYHSSSDNNNPSGNLKSNSLDFALGTYYEKDNFGIGFSTTHLTKTKFNLKEEEASEETSTNTAETYADRTFYLLGKYNIILRNPLYKIQPSVLVKTTLNNTQYDLNTKIIYKETISGGLGWRINDAAIVYLGIKLPVGIKLNYSYDLYLNKYIQDIGGCHEIYITYSKKITRSKTRKSKKSVRFL